MKTSLSKFIKPRVLKTVALVLSVAMLMGIAPFSEVFSFTQNASAEVVPEYNPTYGTYFYDEAANTLTAVPYDNCGFRAWYYNGEEVSIEETCTVADGTEKDDYIPVFYNFNMLDNGNFENYSVGTDVMTNAISQDETWYANETCAFATADITSDFARTDGLGVTKATETDPKSLRVNAKDNTIYRYIDGLEENKQYTVKFYYTFGADAIAAGARLRYASVVVDYVAGIDNYACMTQTGGTVISGISHTNQSYAEGKWKELSITFNTGSKTKVGLCISYEIPSASDETSPYIYIDDMSLVEDELADGSGVTNFNDKTYTGWNTTGDNVAISTEARLDDASDYRLKIANTAAGDEAQSPSFSVKTGYSYEISFKLDLGNTAETGANTVIWALTKESKAVSDGNYLLNTSSTYNSSGYESTVWDYAKYSEASSNRNYFKVVEAGTSKKSYQGFSKEECLNVYGTESLNSSDLYVTISFTAPRSGTAYFNIYGTAASDEFYIDDFNIEEYMPASNYDAISSYISNYGIECVGTAIRTSGKQGLRYKTEIDKRLLCADKYFGVRVTEYGTVAIRSNYLSPGDELVLDQEYTDPAIGTTSSRYGYAYLLNDDEENGRSKRDIRYSETATGIHYTGVLINIDEEYYNTDYTIRSYVKYVDENGDVNTVYSDPLDTTVYTVTKLAYAAKNADGTFAESASTRDYLYNSILKDAEGNIRYLDKTININNVETEAINDNFQGISTTVYNAFTFMEDSFGRYYTDEAAEEEVRRLADSGINNVRSAVQDEWSWTSSGWDWESKSMQAVYKWAKLLKKYGITITINPYSCYEFVNYYEGNGSSSGGPVENLNDYLHGVGDCISIYDSETDTLLTGAAAIAKENELVNELIADITNATLNITSVDGNYTYNRIFDDYTVADRNAAIAHYAKAAIRYGEWMRAMAEAIETYSGNEVECILSFTESGNPNRSDPNYTYDEWIVLTAGLNNVLVEAGVRDDYKIIGPSQSVQFYIPTANLDMISYTLNFAKNNPKYTEFVDIYSAHQYTNPNEGGAQIGASPENTIYEPYAAYNFAEKNFEFYKSCVGDSGVEFWSDEYHAYSKPTGTFWAHGVGMQLTQFAAGLTAAMNNGTDRLISWFVQEQIWGPTNEQGYDNYSATNGEYISGILACGTASSLAEGHFGAYAKYASKAPRVTYYGINLLGKYLENKNALVFSSQVVGGLDTTSGGLYTSAIRGDDGKMVVLVVNTTAEGTSVNVNLEEAVGDTFARYTYNPSGITPTEEAKSLPSDGTLSSTDGTFYDVIPPRSFCLYVEQGAAESGDELDIDTDSIFGN